MTESEVTSDKPTRAANHGYLRQVTGSPPTILESEDPSGDMPHLCEPAN